MTATPVKTIPTKTGLRTGALGFPALLAQSVALISPTMTAVLIIPLAFSSAGQGTWLAYLFGTVMLLFVVLCLNQFTKRSAAPGAMYTYTARGLGPATGVVSGWTLLWCYLFIGTAGLTGFAIFCQQFLDALGATVTVPPDHLLRDQRRDLLVHRLQGHPHIVADHAGVRGHLGHAHPRAGGGRAVQARLHRRHRPAQAQGRRPARHEPGRRRLHLQPGRIRKRDRARQRGEEPAPQRARAR